MQHNFVFQLTFYPFQDKINKLSLKIFKDFESPAAVKDSFSPAVV